MKIKIKALILLVLVLLQILILSMFQIDVQRFESGKKPFFAQRYGVGGEIIEYNGLGYTLSLVVPMTSSDGSGSGTHEIIEVENSTKIPVCFMIFDVLYFIIFIGLDRTNHKEKQKLYN